jgi:hypothetical protein
MVRHEKLGQKMKGILVFDLDVGVIIIDLISTDIDENATLDVYVVGPWEDWHDG